MSEESAKRLDTPMYTPARDDRRREMMYAPQSTDVRSDAASTLPWVIGAVGVYWLLSSGLLDTVSKSAEKVIEKVTDVVEAAGDVVIGVLDMVKLTIIWPKLLYDQITAPEKELAAYYTDCLSKAIALVKTTAYAQSICYIGYNRRLTPISFDEKYGRYRNDFAHALDLCGMMKDDGSWDRPIYYRASPSWAQIHIVGIHRTKPWFMVDGHVYCTLPENSYIIDLIRLGQDRNKGFNIWKDGSNHHAVEGQLEGILFRLLLWPVEPDTLGPGATDVLLYRLSIESYTKDSRAPYLRRRAAPLYGGFPDGDMEVASVDWIIKTYVPIGVDKFGDTEEGRFTPDYLAYARIMTGVYVAPTSMTCTTSPLSMPWALALSPTDEDVREMPDGARYTSAFATFGMDLRHTSLANASGWELNLPTAELKRATARYRTFPDTPQKEVRDYIDDLGTRRQWQIAVTAKGELTAFHNRAYVKGE